MNTESEVITYAIHAFAQHVIEKGLLEQDAFIQHMNEAEFKLRKMLRPEQSAASEIISTVFNTITGQIDN